MNDIFGTTISQSSNALYIIWKALSYNVIKYHSFHQHYLLLYYLESENSIYQQLNADYDDNNDNTNDYDNNIQSILYMNYFNRHVPYLI